MWSLADPERRCLMLLRGIPISHQKVSLNAKKKPWISLHYALLCNFKQTFSNKMCLVFFLSEKKTANFHEFWTLGGGAFAPNAFPLDPPVYVAIIFFVFNARMSFATLMTLAEVLR